MKRAISLILAAAMLGTALVGCSGQKSTYPTRNVNVVVQYSAGGPTDLSVRSLLNSVTDLPGGVNFAVSNVTGGSGLIGVNQAHTAKADGYTLGIINIDLAINYALGRTQISPNDFVPLASALEDPYGLLVGKSAPYQDFKSFIEYAKAHPGEVVVGDSGVGTAPYLAAAAVEQKFGVKFKHVSFSGTSDTITAIVGGHIDATFSQPGSALSQIQAGNISMLAVLADERMTTFKDVPTVKESYPDMDFQIIGWVFVAAPKGVGDDEIKYLKDKLGAASTSDKYKEALASLNMQEITMKPDDLAGFVDDQINFYKDLTKDMQIT